MQMHIEDKDKTNIKSALVVTSLMSDSSGT